MSELDETEYEKVRQRMQGYHQPPATPKEEMWGAVRASWQDQALKRKRTKQRKVWYVRGLAAAAILILGVALGRMSSPVAIPSGSVVPVVVEETGVSAAYRLAASRHFDQAETLLLLFEDDPSDDQFAPQARSLLTTTRILLDSRAASDPLIKDILLDLELVLSQLVHLEPGNDLLEREIITNSVEENVLLPRLRNLAPTTRL